jgi:hypothetical protein
VKLCILQFPDCDDDNAISVSCLDLCYSVKARVLKDEKKDETAPVVLLEILEEDKKDCITEKGNKTPSLHYSLSLSLTNGYSTIEEERKSSVSLMPSNIISAVRYCNCISNYINFFDFHRFAVFL